MTKVTDKRYLLYGTGWEAEKLLYRLPELSHKIVHCIDASRNKPFHGFAVKRLEETMDLQQSFILVATRWEVFLEIRKILNQQGLHEFKDFIWACTLKKKIVVINANCHGVALRNLLKTSEDFQDRYIIYPISEVHLNEQKELGEVVHYCDVYIHQDIRSDNSIGYKISDTYVIPQLKSSCMSITMPNLVGMGGYLYPELGELSSVYVPIGRFDVFYRNTVLDEAHERGCREISDYMRYHREYQLNSNHLDDLYEKNVAKIAKREENWDIKIAGFIKDNFRRIPCFVDKDHPSSYVMKEIARQAARFLDINDLRENECDVQLGLSTPMLGCVKEHFLIHYEYPTDAFRSPLSDHQKGKIYNVEEYIRLYLWWFYGARCIG